MARSSAHLAYLFSTVAAVALVSHLSHADSDEDGASKSDFKALEFKCSTGPKSFNTRIVKPARDDYEKGSTISATLMVGEEKVSPKMRLIIDGQTITEGDGDVTWNPMSGYGEGDKSSTLAKVFQAKLKAGSDDPIRIDASVELKSGSCVATVNLLAEAPRILAEELVAKAARESQIKEINSKCLAEVNKPDVRAAYLNGYLCVLDKCDAESAELRRQEGSKGNNVGYVNKVVLYGVGTYQVLSKKERATTVAGLSSLGGSATCKVPAAKVGARFFVNTYGNPICMGSVPAASLNKSECFAKMFKDGDDSSVGYWAGASDRMKEVAKKGWGGQGSHQSFVSERTEPEEDESNLDPDVLVQRKKMAKLREEAKWNLTDAAKDDAEPVIVDLARQERMKKFKSEWQWAARSGSARMVIVGREFYGDLGPKRSSDFVLPYAAALLMENDPAEAIRVLSNEKYSSEDEGSRLTTLLMAHYLTDDKAKAMSVAEQYSALKPTDVAAALMPAETALAFKDYSSAEKMAREVDGKFPNQPEAKALLGQCLLEGGKAKEAIDLLRKHVDEQADSVAGRNALAYILAKQKTDLKEAQKLIEKAISLNTDKKKEPTLKATLGFVLLQRDEPEDALANLSEAYKENDSSPEIIRDLAAAYIANGKHADAARLYRKSSTSAFISKADRASFQKEASALESRTPASE